MRTPLFLDQGFKPTFEKISMPVKLSDQPENWQREISSQVYQQLPYLSSYAVNIILDRVDPQRGYAFGAIEVSNPTEKVRGVPGTPESMQPDEPSSPSITARIPVIVKDRVMQPLDVFLAGSKAFPLTEERLTETLFRPGAFELSLRKPSDQGMVDQLYPPQRSNYGYGNATATGAVGVGGFGKVAAAISKVLNSCPIKKTASLLEAISPTISEQDVEEMVTQIEKDPETRYLAAQNPDFQNMAMSLASTPRQSVEKTAYALIDNIKPTVIQFTKLASGNIKFKWANAGAFAPQEDVVPPQTADQMTGAPGLSAGMQPGDSVTVSTEKAQKVSLTEPAAKKIEDYGKFTCSNSDTGENVTGWVIPVVDFDMLPMELFIFTDGGNVHGLQDDIVGVQIDSELDLPIGHGVRPEGNGAFCYIDNTNNRIVASLPITIKSTTTTPESGVTYQVETVYGDPLDLVHSDILQGFQKIDEGTYAIPGTFEWLPLRGQPVHLLKTEEEAKAVAAAGAAPNSVSIGATAPDEVSLSGPPVDGVEKQARQFLKHAEAEFLLVGMGATQTQAREKIAEAHKFGTATLTNLTKLIPLHTVHDQMTKQAAEMLESFPMGLRRNLIKEAAALEDSETADKILAMNFINPENVSIFANYLPSLESASSKLAEMLLASRLGLNTIPDGAVERSMKNLEEVIRGLKALNQKEVM